MLTINEVLTRGVEQILPNKKELASLMTKKKLTLYQGFDPSMPSLHLGNFVGLMKLRQFQQLGHKVIFLVGDFTGMIGDPDKISTRVPLTREQTLKNSEMWKEQASKVLDFSGKNPAQILFNSKWNDQIELKEFLKITSHFTVQQILERDMFQKRLKENLPIRVHELLYPIIQAIDSIKMVSGGVDLEIGGNDQLFNLLAGRELMKAVWKKEKYILTTKLLVDKEGSKVGKTTGNALFLNVSPNVLFGGIMAFPDETISLGFELLTEVDLIGLEGKIKADPLSEKKRLAFEVVKILWGPRASQKAQAQFEQTFQKHRIPTGLPTVTIKEKKLALLDLVFSTRRVASRSEAKRLITQGAVEIDSRVTTNPTEEIEIPNHGLTIKIGKKTFVQVCY